MFRQSLPYIIAVAALWAFASCTEIGPDINLGGNNRDADLLDTTYVASNVDAPQTKQVMIMDFTGVKCKNCPTGAQQIEDLKTQYPGKILSAGMFSDFLSDPYTGDEDLRTDVAQDVQDMLAPFLGKPSAAIDMNLFSGENGVLVTSVSKWAGFVSQRVGLTPPVNLTVENTYNATSRELVVRVTAEYTSAVSGDNRLSVMLVEDGIVTSQLLPNNDVDTSYAQHNVLRDMLTRFNGELLDVDKTAGRVVIKEFRLDDVPAVWNADNLNVIAYIHRFGGSFEVLQAAEEPVIP